MSDRSANASLLGYYYQFDKTICEILTANDGSVFTVEGIEDIDIENINETTVIQCKYLNSKKYSPAILRKPIIYMLDNFIKKKKKTIYYLHIYFEDSVETINFDLSLLKQILTYSKGGKRHVYYQEKEITDDVLNKFLKKFKFVVGEDFKTQHEKAMAHLTTTLNCDSEEAGTYYYSKSLQKIFDLATQKNITDRKISKHKFIQTLKNDSVLLFNKWLYIFKGDVEYKKYIKKWIKTCEGLHTHKNKLIFLENKLLKPEDYGLNFVQFIKNLLDKHYKINKHLKGVKTWTLVLDANKAELTHLKEKLIDQEIIFNDGFESIKFSPNLFNKLPVTICDRANRLSQSSYLLKIISKKQYEKHRKKIDEPEIVFHFSSDFPTKYFKTTACLFQIQAKNLQDVSSFI